MQYDMQRLSSHSNMLIYIATTLIINNLKSYHKYNVAFFIYHNIRG